MGCVWQPSHPLEFEISSEGAASGRLSRLVLFLQSSAILPLPWEKLRKNTVPEVGFVGLGVGLEMEIGSGGGIAQDCKKSN